MRMMPEIGARAREEVERLGALGGMSVWRYAAQSGLRSQYSSWGQGMAPMARSLVKLARGGADVKYILTGRRGGKLEIPEEPIEQIGKRAYQEVERIADKQNVTKLEVMKRLGAGKRTEYAWKAGGQPSALYLVRLHYMGANLNYIFTGRKCKDNDQEIYKTKNQGRTAGRP